MTALAFIVLFVVTGSALLLLNRHLQMEEELREEIKRWEAFADAMRRAAADDESDR